MTSGIYKRKPFTKEHKRHLSEALMGEKSPNWGKHFSKQTLKKMSIAQKGRTFSLETRKKMSAAQLGKKSHNWKGGIDTYRAIHNWINKWGAKSDTCEFCGKTGLLKQKINWANKSGKYLRDTSDWLRLCVSCHRQYDIKRKDNGK